MFEALPESLEVSASDGEGEISGTCSRSRRDLARKMQRQTGGIKGDVLSFFGANFQILNFLANVQEPVTVRGNGN